MIRWVYFSVSLMFGSVAGFGQTPHMVAPPVNPAEAARLAETGHCPQALPQLKRSLVRLAGSDLKRRVGVAGVHCAVTLNQPAEAAAFLAWLDHEFPHDPAVLYLASHVYSDLSLNASNELLYTHPESAEVHELNAETLEMQNKWKEAAEEYRVILGKSPDMPGIHFRLGRVLLSEPNAPATVKEDARQEFEQELKIDPTNAGAEFVLGELARQADNLPNAISHFRRAVQLDVSFSDAQMQLGRALLDGDQPAEAIRPLEAAEKLRPEDPEVHFHLSAAYRKSGRRADADREAELHRETAQRATRRNDEFKRQISGGSVQPAQ